MSLESTLLEKLADYCPDGRQPLVVPGEPWAVTLTADRADQLGCLVWELALRRSAPPAGANPLQAWAERVAGRVTGLLEPLKLLEVDSLRDEALLRSEEPTPRGGKLFYYELLLKGRGEALLRRYHGAHNGQARREQVAFAVTHEALAKLVADLTADG
jgi:hypothetical protein